MKCEMWLCKPARREAGVSIMVHEAVTPPSPIVDMRAHDVLVRSSLSFSHQIVLGQLKIRDTGWHSKPPYQPTGCSMGMCCKLVQRSLFSYPLPIYFAAPSFSGMATTGLGDHQVITWPRRLRNHTHFGSLLIVLRLQLNVRLGCQWMALEPSLG